MSKIGILYLCTGPYALFWDDFYSSFEKKFLPDVVKHYYVFTDNDATIVKHDNISIYHLDAQPWPLITLLRFHTFLKIEDELKSNDYLMFSNSNIICEKTVTSQEFLPRKERGENLFFVEHPGYYKLKPQYAPFDRNPKSLAYVPYNCGNTYVIGAMFGGNSDSFLKMSHTLRERINSDLKRGVIAKWHDESHINRYIIGRSDCRVLSPSYCYPVGFELPVERKIAGVSKQDKFDVNKFKGYDQKKQNALNDRTKKDILNLEHNLLKMKDSILQKKLDKTD